MDEIVNRVAQSALVSFDLEDIKPKGDRVLFDIKDQLFQGIVLREKDFRLFLKEHDWSIYEGKHIAITCSTEAIIPTWAYMLLTTRFEKYAETIVFGDLDRLEEALFEKAIKNLDTSSLEDKPIVIKGCSKEAVPTSAYLNITEKLRPIAKTIMFGEPCSTVPIYKKPRQK
ncbi:DUF2480 family protein [Flammeovirga pacifica]|uniref:DUF2480 family protein n=1 Tax=Flammeovirga pacifica TaxID=915059 RepID=A0A1S1Z2U8_FLAPC|nr:DUF2480 family protein [Flammeovirga pacifica]OHX67599.1 hypothetical protein NH26_15195 [Flammeovirga pacifica]